MKSCCSRIGFMTLILTLWNGMTGTFPARRKRRGKSKVANLQRRSGATRVPPYGCGGDWNFLRGGGHGRLPPTTHYRKAVGTGDSAHPESANPRPAGAEQVFSDAKESTLHRRVDSLR